jgi:hypothetical protein
MQPPVPGSVSGSEDYRKGAEAMGRKEAERRAKSKTIEEMKLELGLDRTVQGHARLTRDEVIDRWTRMMTY